MRRQRIFLLIGAGAAVLAGGGLAASTLVRSPAQIAADSRPPQASTPTAEVEFRKLTATVVTRGTVTADRQVQVTPAAATGTDAQPVLTRVFTSQGKEVRPGSVLFEVAGRPLIALPGAQPAYRDLRPDSRGRDVKQLQRALADLGFGSGGDEPGYFGPGTKQAVSKFYSAKGYDVPTTGGPGGPGDQGDTERLNAAEDAVYQAQNAVDDFRRQMKNKKDKADASPVPAKVRLARLEHALDQAERALARLVATTGPMAPVGEFVFLPRFPAQVTQFSARVGDTVKSPLITIATGGLSVTSDLSPDQGRLLKAGMKVEILDESGGRKAEGTISLVGPVTTDSTAEAASTSEQNDTQAATNTAPHVTVKIKPSRALGPSWSGRDVRLTITSASSEGDVLIVPLSAVTTGADGKTSVSKAVGTRLTRVEVVAGLSGDGFVAVEPVTEGSLRKGDRVSVSY